MIIRITYENVYCFLFIYYLGSLFYHYGKRNVIGLLIYAIIGLSFIFYLLFALYLKYFYMSHSTKRIKKELYHLKNK